MGDLLCGSRLEGCTAFEREIAELLRGCAHAEMTVIAGTSPESK